MSEPNSLGADNPESGDPDTTSLYGDLPSDPADAGDIETNLDNENELMSADGDPLPDDEVSDPNSTPQGPPLS